jgi:hypothetical protein
MSSFTIKSGSTLPALSVQLLDSTGAGIDLTSATVTMTMRSRSGSLKIDAGPCSIVTASTGIVSYAWQAEDTDTIGLFDAEFTATFSGGVEIAPSSGYLTVIVSQSLA